MAMEWGALLPGLVLFCAGWWAHSSSLSRDGWQAVKGNVALLLFFFTQTHTHTHTHTPHTHHTTHHTHIHTHTHTPHTLHHPIISPPTAWVRDLPSSSSPSSHLQLPLGCSGDSGTRGKGLGGRTSHDQVSGGVPAPKGSLTGWGRAWACFTWLDTKDLEQQGWATKITSKEWRGCVADPFVAWKWRAPLGSVGAKWDGLSRACFLVKYFW